ncbi:DUF4232 domain-containing protein [Streptomyces sp. NPDC007264]|uniref:DUF4232 domain-containing protein n=1 Tax=Streptomyces sp. NPDC007264 TaxID=3364777 RepID=UPI0036DF20B4
MNATACTNGKSPRGWRACALGAAAVAVLLATTACEPGGDDAADASKSPAQSSATTSPTAKTTPTATAKTTAPGDGKGGSQESKGTGGEDNSSIPLCSLGDLSISAMKFDGDEPTRHILIVATNKSGKKCDVLNAPEVTLGDAKGPAPRLEGSTTDDPVTLAPGEKAYAGLLATGGHMDTYDVTSMTITLGSPGGETEAEKPVDLPMPVAAFPADDGQRVTTWAGTEGLAMRPVTLR